EPPGADRASAAAKPPSGERIAPLEAELAALDRESESVVADQVAELERRSEAARAEVARLESIVEERRAAVGAAEEEGERARAARWRGRSPRPPAATRAHSAPAPPVPVAPLRAARVAGADPPRALARPLLSDAWVVERLDDVPDDFAGIAVTRSGRAWFGAG